MTCASCASRIERRLNKLDGVNATVNYATRRRRRYDAPRQPSTRRSRRSRRLSAVLPTADEQTRPRRRDAAVLLRVLVSAAFSLPLLLISMIPALQFDRWQWLALQLATPVVLWAAWPFHRAAWTNLTHGLRQWTRSSPSACSPPGSGRSTPSSSATPARRGCGCRSSSCRARRRRERDLPRDRRRGHHVHPGRPLLRGPCQAARRIRPQEAARARRERRVHPRPDGNERRVPIDQLQVGDRFVVRPGEKIATDGVVEEGPPRST